MKQKTFKVPIHGLSVTLIEIESSSDLFPLRRRLKSMDMTEEFINKVSDNIHRLDSLENLCSEFVYDKEIEKALIILYGKEYRFRVLGFNKRLLEDNIEMNYDVQSMPLLSGLLTAKLFN